VGKETIITMAGNNNETHLTLSQTNVSRIVVLCILCMLFIFITGYYLGKKNQSEELAEHMHQGAFADQIHSSLYTMYSPQEHEKTA
jgi:hypothetical protein